MMMDSAQENEDEEQGGEMVERAKLEEALRELEECKGRVHCLENQVEKLKGEVRESNAR